MNTNKRHFQRFFTALKIKAVDKNGKFTPGLIKDFSRKGLRAEFDDFEFNALSDVFIKIQKPLKNAFIEATARVMWKKVNKNKNLVGLELIDMPSAAKADILEHCYNKWVKENICQEAK